MKKLDIYLETSIFNFVFADDAPDKRDDTIKLFDEIRSGKYQAHTSATAIDELTEAPDPKRSKMMSLISEYDINIIQLSATAENLADMYVAEGMIPEKYAEDAIHIATASIENIDIIISWNFKHIVKRKTRILTNAINAREGYKQIDIYSPSEVIENDDE